MRAAVNNTQPLVLDSGLSFDASLEVPGEGGRIHVFLVLVIWPFTMHPFRDERDYNRREMYTATYTNRVTL